MEQTAETLSAAASSRTSKRFVVFPVEPSARTVPTAKCRTFARIQSATKWMILIASCHAVPCWQLGCFFTCKMNGFNMFCLQPNCPERALAASSFEHVTRFSSWLPCARHHWRSDHTEVSPLCWATSTCEPSIATAARLALSRWNFGGVLFWTLKGRMDSNCEWNNDKDDQFHSSFHAHPSWFYDSLPTIPWKSCPNESAFQAQPFSSAIEACHFLNSGW